MRGLLLVDIQGDYFPGGAYPLVGAEAAADAAHEVLADARAARRWVGHVRHAGEEGSSFLRAGTPGAEIHPAVAPAHGEAVIEKTDANSFLGTDLAEILAEADVDELDVVGMMSSMCVDATVREALDRGLAVTVVEDACAAPDLAYGDVTVDGRTVHLAFMAALRDAGAEVVTRGG